LFFSTIFESAILGSPETLFFEKTRFLDRSGKLSKISRKTTPTRAKVKDEERAGDRRMLKLDAPGAFGCLIAKFPSYHAMLV